MRFLLALTVLLLGVNALDQEWVKKVTVEIMEVANVCVKQEDATAADLKELILHHYPPNTHAAKCVIACFYEHYKMLKEDGTFDTEATIEIFNELKEQDADIHAKVLTTIRACHANTQIFDDRCETASAMATCIKKEAEAVGLTPETFG